MKVVLLLVLGIQVASARPTRGSRIELDDRLARLYGCEPEMVELVNEKYPECTSLIVQERDCHEDVIMECVERSLGGEFGRGRSSYLDMENCPDCNNNKTNVGEVILGSLAILAGPLSQGYINRQWAKSYTNVERSRHEAFGRYADALKEFPQACVNGFDSYLDHRSQLGINSALSADGAGSFFDQCSNLSQYAGFGGHMGNGFGGHGNVWQGGGYSPGFLGGMVGPYGGFGGGVGGGLAVVSEGALAVV